MFYMSFIKEKIKITCDNLAAAANKKLFDLSGIEYVMCDYKTDNTPPDDGWMPLDSKDRIFGKDGHCWFRASFKTPKTENGESIYLKCTTGKEGQWDATNPQGLVYLNGKMVQGLDTNHVDVYLEPDTDYEFLNYFYVGPTLDETDVYFSLYKLDEVTEQLYYDMLVAYDAACLSHENSDEYIAVIGVLEQTANLIDFREVGGKAFKESVIKAIDYIGEELYHKLCSVENKPIVHCVGHTHIDVEWLWHRAQTREKVQRSFSTAIALMERYPEYKFMLSQPELYRYLKEEAPEKYEELKKLVKEGRFEPEGAMYVEADCNLISGESFVRQILQGKKFFKDEFDVDCNILFLPDVFGYSAALPQILKKSGIDYFVTSKIAWNESNTMPVDRFMWEGIDGTEIYTNFITTQEYKGMNPPRYTTYVGHLNPTQVKGTWVRFSQKEYGNRTMTTYGWGDGGGGPTKHMLETQRRLSKGLPGMPVTEMSSLREYLDKTKTDFDKACDKTKRTPKWVGELYLEFHRGTYTSMAKVKRANRKAELGLSKTEALSFTDLYFGGDYDAEGIYDKWNKVLHNQFHDIIPGSSIKEVYDGTDKDYAEIEEYINSVSAEKLEKIANSVSEEGILVYNPSGFPRRGVVVLSGKTVELSDSIPAFGWKVVKDVKSDSKVEIKDLTAENKYYRITLDKAGRISELYDKTANRQVIKSGEKANELQAFEDYPRQYDNWEITDYYKEKMYVLDTPADIIPISDGTRKGFKISRKYMDSTISQNLWIYTDCPRIDFETEIDWHQHHQILKTAFPLDVHTNTATYDIQFGHTQRPTHANTSWDKAKFETCGHKWVDMSENGYGVALLNDCKYGHSAEGSTLKLTILKCGTHPNPEADQGRHILTYSLLPHTGDFRTAGVINEAYALNQPLTAIETSASGSLPETFSLVSCNKPNIIIETVKKAEEDESMLVRMYEAFDSRGEVTVTVPDGFKKAYLCNLMEKELKRLDLKDGKVNIPYKNFEIITLKFSK